MQITFLGALLICLLLQDSYSWGHSSTKFMSFGSSHDHKFSERNQCFEDLCDALFQIQLTDSSGVDSGLLQSAKTPDNVTTDVPHKGQNLESKNAFCPKKEILTKCAQENNITVSTNPRRGKWGYHSGKRRREVQEEVQDEVQEGSGEESLEDKSEEYNSYEEGDYSGYIYEDDDEDGRTTKAVGQRRRKRRHSYDRREKERRGFGHKKKRFLVKGITRIEKDHPEKVSSVSKCILSELNIINSDNALNIAGISSAISNKFSNNAILRQEFHSNLNSCTLPDNYNITVLLSCIQKPCESLSEGRSDGQSRSRFNFWC